MYEVKRTMGMKADPPGTNLSVTPNIELAGRHVVSFCDIVGGH